MSTEQSELADGKFTVQELLVTKTPLLTGTDVNDKRREIRQYFHKTYSLFEQLFEQLVNDEAFPIQAIKLRHPHIFYWGHTAVFMINKLRLARVISTRVNGHIESMCAVGVDEMSWDDLNSEHYDWPSAEAIREYRNEVRQVVDRLICTLPLTLPITWDSPWWIILMGCEHERIHLETSSVLLRQTKLQFIKPNPIFTVCPDRREDPQDVPANELLPVPAGDVITQRAKDEDPIYGWDLEYGTPISTHVQGFEASKYLVSNKEFLEFMQADGYHTRQYWTDEGWRFATWSGPLRGYHPTFWVPSDESEAKRQGGQVTYRYRCMAQEIDMPWDWPVDVNYLEAKAFCNWKSATTGKSLRLPSEAEWHLLRDYAYPQQNPGEADQPYWNKAPGNINLEAYASSTPIDAHMFEHGFGDIIGNVWQHTETPADAFKGYKTHRYYDDFSLPTFDNQHNQIKGGSWMSTGNEATRKARYAFRRHFYQHAGFRYIETDVPVPELGEKKVLLETELPIAQALHSHYGPDFMGITNYSTRIADLCINTFGQLHSDLKQSEGESSTESKGRDLTQTTGLRALDLGCGAGRATLELAKVFDLALGVDLTTKYVRIGQRLKEGDNVQFALPIEGEVDQAYSTDLHTLGLTDVAAKVDFLQCDCNNLDPKYHDFDLVLVSGLLEVLYDPGLFLRSIHTRMRPGGVLVVASTFNWNTEYTPREQWLGGFKVSAENVFGNDGVESCLSEHFTRVGEAQQMPFVVKQGGNKHMLDSYHVTCWQLKTE